MFHSCGSCCVCSDHHSRAATRKFAGTGYFKVYLPLITVDYPAPPSSPSYYARNVSTSAWYSRGYSLGTLDNDGRPHDRLIVVDFGYPARLNGIYGVYLPFDQTGTFSSTSVVASALTEFARGYWVGTGSNTAAKLHIAVGTNNCCVGVALSVFQGHGTAWAQMMNSISATVDSYASQVTVVAASDMELEFNGPYTTTQWIANFMNARQCTPSVDEQGCLYNFGNQTAAVPTTSQGPCNYTNTITTTWKACDVWYVSWGAKRSGDTYPYIRALPEIYHAPNPPSYPYGTDATAWAALSQYSHDFRITLPSSGRIYFAGSLTQFASCGPICNDGSGNYNNNRPDEGWYALSGALRSKPNTYHFVRWSTDIGIQP